MSPKYDIICCQGLDYECHIGFHDYELHGSQKITVDLTAFFSFTSAKCSDAVASIRFDYFIANQKIKDFLNGKRFNLIETLAQEVAKLLLQEFKVEKINVRVTKYPLDMPNMKSVFFECERQRE